jgi:hypothetical protein
MPSADFCPITPDATPRRPARVTVESGGVSSTFVLALSSTPIAAQAAGEADLPEKVAWSDFSRQPPGTGVSLMDETNSVSPGKVGALECEPLKRLIGVANAAHKKTRGRL